MRRITNFGRLLALLAVGAAVVWFGSATRADVIHLKSGKSVECTVTGYADMTFNVTGSAASTYQSLVIKKIEFEPRNGPSFFETRSRGTVKGMLKSYQDSAFSILNEKGQAESISAVFITRLTVGVLPEQMSDNDQAGGAGGGEEVDLKEKLVAGKVNIVEFYFPGHPACRLVTAYLEQLAAKDADVALIKIDIGGWNTPVAKQHAVTAVPRVDVYARNGKRLGSVEGNRQPQIGEYVKQAKKS